MHKRSIIITLLILLVVSSGLNIYFIYRLSRDEPERDLVCVPSSSDEQELLFHALTALDALEGIGASLEDLNVAIEQTPGEAVWQECLIALNRALYQLVGAAAQLEETLELVARDHPQFVSGIPSGLYGAALPIAASDPAPSYEEILEQINALAADLAQIQQGDPATQQIRLQHIMTEINQLWTVTASGMQALYQLYYELARQVAPGA